MGSKAAQRYAPNRMVAGPGFAAARCYRASVAILGPIGTPELIIIMVVLLLLFGAKRLPEMGRSIGRGMREFKDAVTGEETPTSDVGELSAPVESPAHEPKADGAPADKTEREPVS